MQSFGGPWTLIKLEVLEKYLGFYTTALKRKNLKLCYIDAFAGSGELDLRGIGSITGSAVRALDYPFDRFIFIEKDEKYAKCLAETVKLKKRENVTVMIGDCNELLNNINAVSWYQQYWRGIIFLDPYAMNLKWASLQAIAQTRVFDIWYLFPLSALIRVLRKDGQIDAKSRETITSLLGTDEWGKAIYSQSQQLSLFGEQNVERVPIESITKYIVGRLQEIFPGVAENPLVLRNPQNNSPLFLLCFAVSNSNSSAINLSLKAANHILTHTG